MNKSFKNRSNFKRKLAILALQKQYCPSSKITRVTTRQVDKVRTLSIEAKYNG